MEKGGRRQDRPGKARQRPGNDMQGACNDQARPGKSMTGGIKDRQGGARQSAMEMPGTCLKQASGTHTAVVGKVSITMTSARNNDHIMQDNAQDA